MDLPDGSLQIQYGKYKQRLERAGTVGLHKESMVQDLNCVVEEVSQDLKFLQSGGYDQHNSYYVLFM